MSDIICECSDGCDGATLLTIVFVALKLCGVISWSWWWVTCPLWGALAIALTICVIVFTACLVIASVEAVFGRKKL